jgi:hypothetical protein
MDPAEESPLDRIARSCAELRAGIDELDQAIATCQRARREALAILAELDAARGEPGEPTDPD